MKRVELAHGSGGLATHQLVKDLFIRAFDNPWLSLLEDQARLELNDFNTGLHRLAFSTDSYVIDPLFFPGGDIGKLAVCGTVNDIAVSGATPRWLSCGFIIEEGLPLAELERIVDSMASAAKRVGISIVTGDTKVVPCGAADKLFINTAGIGVIPGSLNWGAGQIAAGDSIIVTGTLGDHGATILNIREQLGFKGALESDCAALDTLIAPLIPVAGVKALRDATRGGVNAVLHEFSAMSGCGIEITERELPLSPAVRGICELLGLDALNLANEAKLVIVASGKAAPVILSHLKNHPLGVNAAVIGEVVSRPGVRICGLYGVRRTLDLPHSEPLPRIC